MERIFCSRCMKDWVKPSDTGKDEFGKLLQGYRCPTCRHRIEFVVDTPTAEMLSAVVGAQLISPLPTRAPQGRSSIEDVTF